MAQQIHVWQHFSMNSSDSSRVNCKTCNKSIAHGGKQATAFNTSNKDAHDQRAFPSTGARDCRRYWRGLRGGRRKETVTLHQPPRDTAAAAA